MTPKLSEEQRTALQVRRGTPLEVEDPQTQTMYVLVTRDEFLRLQSRSADDLTPEEMLAAAAQGLDDPEGWGAPGMDEYDRLGDAKTDSPSLMSFARGDIVLIEFPAGPGNAQLRPAVVVQTDVNNVRLTSAIFAMVTSNTRLARREPTQVLLDINAPDGVQTGLRHTSAVKCENLYTLPMTAGRKIGHLTPQLLAQVDRASEPP